MASGILPSVDVAVNIVRRADGCVLLAERTARQVASGFWELPGGKIERGETASAAAARELFEEIGIRPRALRPWKVYEHAFRTKRVRLHFFEVSEWTGVPVGRENQRLAWADPAAPNVAPILPSNERALSGLGLPAIYLVAGDESPEEFLARLPSALVAGVRLIAAGKPNSAPDQRVTFARRVEASARRYGATVLIAGSALEARRAGAAGVHSTSAQLRRTQVRPPVKIWSVACDDAADLMRANALGADIATLSPALGWENFSRLAAEVTIPLYASDGMTPAQAGTARQHGAAGVAIDIAAAPIEPAVRN